MGCCSKKNGAEDVLSDTWIAKEGACEQNQGLNHEDVLKESVFSLRSVPQQIEALVVAEDSMVMPIFEIPEVNGVQESTAANMVNVRTNHFYFEPTSWVVPEGKMLCNVCRNPFPWLRCGLTQCFPGGCGLLEFWPSADMFGSSPTIRCHGIFLTMKLSWQRREPTYFCLHGVWSGLRISAIHCLKSPRFRENCR